MKNCIFYFLTLALPLASLSCGTENASPPRQLTPGEISDLKKNRPYSEAEKRQIGDYRDRVKVFTGKQWKFYMAVWKGSTKPASANLAFVLSPSGKVEAISTLTASDPEFAKASTQAILHWDFPPQPKHLLEIMKEDRNLFECHFEIKETPKRSVIIKNGLLISE